MDPDALKVLLLALCVGLRRGEIDRLLWRQVDFDRGLIRVEVTEAGALKTEDSAGAVQIDEELAALLRGFRAKAKSEYVIDGGQAEGGSVSYGQRYRCLNVFARLNGWLRSSWHHSAMRNPRAAQGSRFDRRDAVGHSRREPILAPCRYCDHRGALRGPQGTHNRPAGRSAQAGQRGRHAAGDRAKGRAMKEFELQGDISSGFRWRVKGATEVEREAFVPLGDSSESALIPRR